MMGESIEITIQPPCGHMLKWLRITMADFLISECRLADLVGYGWPETEDILLNGSTSFYDWVLNGYGLCDYTDLDKIYCLDGLSNEVEYDYQDLLRLEGSLAAGAAYDTWDFCIKGTTDAGDIKANLIVFMNDNFEDGYTNLV